MSNWKSSLLDKLNVGSVTSSERGPGGLVKGMILAATVAVGVGALSNNAYGDQVQKVEQSGFTQAYKMVLHADDFVLDPVRQKAFEGIVGEEAAAKFNEQMDVPNTSTAWHTADIATTAIGIATVGPAMGAWMILKQADDTYEFIQAKQQENVDLKMAQVSERTQSIYDAEIQKMRDQDPAYQQMLATARQQQAEYDEMYAEHEAANGGSKPASDLEQTSTIAASADLPTSTANLDALFPKEKAVEHDRSSELSR
jgi:hypothetical protein